MFVGPPTPFPLSIIECDNPLPHIRQTPQACVRQVVLALIGLECACVDLEGLVVAGMEVEGGAGNSQEGAGLQG